MLLGIFVRAPVPGLVTAFVRHVLRVLMVIQPVVTHASHARAPLPTGTISLPGPVQSDTTAMLSVTVILGTYILLFIIHVIILLDKVISKQHETKPVYQT